MKNTNYVVVAGTFDLFHVGHVEILRRASRYGKVLAVVNTDRFVQEFKKIKPTIRDLDRFHVVRSCEYVDMTIFNDSKDLTKTLKPYTEIITGVVFGDDYDIGKYRKQTQITREWQQEHDIALIQLPRTDNVSSTEIRHKIK